MGVLDRVATLVLHDAVRVMFFYGLAFLAAYRFMSWDFDALLVITSTCLAIAAPIAWDKYALPLLVVLWYMRGAQWSPRVGVEAPGAPAA